MIQRRTNWLSALSAFIAANPKLSATVAFELGIMAASAVKAGGIGHSISSRTAKVIDAIPLIPHAAKPKRKAKRKKSKRATCRQPQAAAQH